MDDYDDEDVWVGHEWPASYGSAFDDGPLYGDDDYDDEWYEDAPDYTDEDVAYDNTFVEIWRLDRPNWREKLDLSRRRARQIINRNLWRFKWFAGRCLDRLRGRKVDPNEIPF